MTPDECERRVLGVVRGFALEVGGPRALQAVTPTASLEREVGLGSLERVELLLRLEAELGCELGDRFLVMDTPREIALAAAEATEKAVARVLPPVRAPSPSLAPAPSIDVNALSTIVDALWRRAEADPARVHAYLQDGAGIRDVTFGALRDGAAAIAAGLAERALKPGDRVAIMLPTGFDFLQSFMGIMAAGLVPVPLYPPARLDRMAEYLLRQAKILANAGARLLVALPEAVPVGETLRRTAPELTGVVTAPSLAKVGTSLECPRRPSGDAALIQYTSGSTGDPKGVLLTHANLLANIRAIARGTALRPTDVAVSWLPLYHDMGLIGTWLSSIVYAIPLALMSPLFFLARPERWLWTIHQRRATISAAPNFAYELCLRKVRDEALQGLDLSSWRCAINGSESVSASTLERFARRFEPYGFRRDALLPVYGLAECSVALTFPPLGRGPVVDRVARASFEREGLATAAVDGDPLALSFVSVGRPLAEHEVRLADERGNDVAERVVGRVFFRGPSAMPRYHNNPDATARAMRPDGWIDSGDLAYRAGGELFVTGRAKDLIIKGGRHVIPQEIEEIAGAIDGVRKGCVVAFGVPDEATGTERLVVLAESRAAEGEPQQRLESAVVEQVAAGTGVPPDEVRIVAPGVVPKTPSGKLRRGEARALYLSGQIARPRKTPLRLRIQLLRGRVAAGCRAVASRAWRGLYAAYLTVALVLAVIVLGIPIRILLALLPGRRTGFVLGRLVGRVLIRLTGCRVTVEGLEHLPRKGPCVLVSNHASYMDSPTLETALPVDFLFVAKRELLSWPLIGALIRKTHHLTVERTDSKQSVSDAARVPEALRDGEIILFFPEGTFTRAAGLRPFRMGAFEAAVATGAPIVPIALNGTRRVLGDGERLPRPGTISVWIGEPLTASGEGWHAALDLRDRAAALIAAHCGEPRLDLVVGGLERPATSEAGTPTEEKREERVELLARGSAGARDTPGPR